MARAICSASSNRDISPPIGLDLYLQMVEQAVQRLKGQVVEEEPDPTLRLSVSAFIPEDYVADSHQRLSLYKRLSSCGAIG